MTAFPIGRPRFITLEECLAWHESALAEYGGLSGVRDITLLESALSMPRQGFGGSYAHVYPFEMAAAYAFHIAKNHPFADGNKRAALLCCGSFLRMNGWDLISVGTEAADAIVAMVEGRLNKSTLASWLESHCKARPAWELRDFFAALEHSQVFESATALNLNDASGIQASIDEASRSMPICADAFLAARAQLQAGRQDEAARTLAQLQLLVVLYRTAEDMGYEW